MTFPPARAALVVALVAALVAAPAEAAGDPLADAVPATDHTADQFLDTFDQAELPGLGAIGPPPSITGDAGLDARIRSLGEARGYRRHPGPSRPLVSVDGFLLQPEAAAAWKSLQAAARAAGHRLSLTSAYRGPAEQASLFRRRLPGTGDAAIEQALTTAAMPGYSRHHTGYAVDIRSSTASGHAFRHSAAYTWLATDAWANLKAHGWIPSYPEGSRPAGPDPEPWEYVWVGATNIVCGDVEPTSEAPFCDTIGSSFTADVEWLLDRGITTGCRAGRFCTASPISRAEAATMLWRYAGEPVADADAAFADVPPGTFYEAAVDWLVSAGLTTGTSPGRFSPHRPLTRAEFVTFLWRFAGHPAAEGPLPFTDVDSDGFAAAAIAWAAEVGVTTGTSAMRFSPAETATRGQAAAFFHRLDRELSL